MYKTLGLFKSHFSLGRSILTLEKPSKDEYPVSVFALCQKNNLKEVVIVDDSISGLLQASKNADELKLKLIFGLRLNVNNSIENQNEESLLKRSKYIIFAKNANGYKDLIKIWSLASTDGFYYSPCIDFKNLKKLWTKNLTLAVPFYDSFLYKNTFYGFSHVPELDFHKPVFFMEDNDLPFDGFLKERVQSYCSKNRYDTLSAQSIYYKSSDDFLAYLAFRCVHSKVGAKKATLEKPDIEHMSSDTFNFDRWLKCNT